MRKHMLTPEQQAAVAQQTVLITHYKRELGRMEADLATYLWRACNVDILREDWAFEGDCLIRQDDDDAGHPGS